MFSIRQSVGQSMWVEAAEALASALSVLPRNKQIALAHSFIDHARKEIAQANKGHWRIRNMRFPPLPGGSPDESPPWDVHVADATDDLTALEKHPPKDDAEFSSKIAAALWDAVVGVQVAAWAAMQTDDFRAWQQGHKAEGVFKSPEGKRVAADHWMKLDQRIRKHREFRGKDDFEIYQVRPAVFALRNIIEAS